MLGNKGALAVEIGSGLTKDLRFFALEARRKMIGPCFMDSFGWKDETEDDTDVWTKVNYVMHQIHA